MAIHTGARRHLTDCAHLFKRRLYVSAQDEHTIRRQFHELYYQTGKLREDWGVRWHGRPVVQCPMDLLAIAWLIQRHPGRPVVEIGTGHGGSALFWRDAGATAVCTIACVPPPTPLPDSVTFILGESLSASTVAAVVRFLADRPALVILDGDHRRDVVLQELHTYSQAVPVGGHVVVCDTHFDGHPLPHDRGPGPWQAVEAFLVEQPAFERDRAVEPMLTWNPGGYLMRWR